MIIAIGLLFVLSFIIAFVYIRGKNITQQKESHKKKAKFNKINQNQALRRQFEYLLLRQSIHYRHYIGYKAIRTLCFAIIVMFVVSGLIFIYITYENCIPFIEKQVILIFSIIMIIIFAYIIKGKKQAQYHRVLKEMDKIIDNILKGKIQLSSEFQRIYQLERKILKLKQ